MTEQRIGRRYYSQRKKPRSLTVEGLYRKLQNLYLMFSTKNYFKEKGGIAASGHSSADEIKYRAAVALDFELFPIAEWSPENITEDHVFDAIEFLYDHISKPGELVDMQTATGFNYTDYESYDEGAGQEEFRTVASTFLADYKTGFELTKDGYVLALGTDGLQHILNAEIIPYDEANVDGRVRNAIAKWRNRRLALSEKKEAIRELADVFEWLKKARGLSSVLDSKDESAIFEIANSFGFRHHDPKQKTNYDRAIWYSWVFHFYLATYHAAIRLLIKKEGDKKIQQGKPRGRTASGPTMT